MILYTVPLKYLTVFRITYTVLEGTLNTAHSLTRLLVIFGT